MVGLFKTCVETIIIVLLSWIYIFSIDKNNYEMYTSNDFVITLRFDLYGMRFTRIGTRITTSRLSRQERDYLHSFVGIAIVRGKCKKTHNGLPSEIVIGRQRTTTRTRHWSTYAHTTVNLLVPNIRPNDTVVPISQLVRNRPNTCRTRGNRSPNSHLGASRWELHPECRKSSLKVK